MTKEEIEEARQMLTECRIAGVELLQKAYAYGLRRGLELAQKHARISTTAPGNPGQAVTPYVDFGGAEKAIEDEVAK